MKTVPIVEIFGPTIQGEGYHSGRPSIFVRTGGCGFRCSWCDSMHAVDPKHAKDWARMTPGSIVEKVVELAQGPMLVTFSGGDPAMHKALGEAIKLLGDVGYLTAIETQGEICPEWLGWVHHATISPKPPSSGMEWPKGLDQIVREARARCVDGYSLKVPVADEADLAFAHRVFAHYEPAHFFVQPVNTRPGDDEQPMAGRLAALRWLMEQVKDDPRCRSWRVGPQLHVLAWGEKIGV